MKTLSGVVFALLLATLPGCASQPTTQTSAAAGADGTLTVRQEGVLRLATGGSGHGTLVLHGWQYPFEVSNMVLSGVGPGAIQLEGDVFNISSVGDFEGTYQVTAAEIESGKGAQGFWFENEKGVKVHIRASGQDVTVRLRGSGSTVRLL